MAVTKHAFEKWGNKLPEMVMEQGRTKYGVNILPARFCAWWFLKRHDTSLIMVRLNQNVFTGSKKQNGVLLNIGFAFILMQDFGAFTL